MVKSLRLALVSLLCTVLMFFISHAYAAPATMNFTQGSNGVWANSGTAGAYNSATNPNGLFFTPSGGGAAGLNGNASVPVTVGAPSGSTPGISLINVALAAGASLGGAAVLSNNYSSTISGPQVAGILQLAGGALIVGSGICGPAAPACAAAGYAVSVLPLACNIVGCTFFNAVAAQGVIRNTDGSFSQSSGMRFPSYSFGGLSGTPEFLHQSLASIGYGAWSSTAVVCDSTGNCVFSGAACAGTCAGLSHTGIASLSTASATNADIVAAVNAATAATNRSTATAAQNAAAADAINLSLLDGLNMSTLAETAVATTIASSFALQKTSTDALGNTVQELSRNLISMSPGANASLPPLLQPSTQNVTITNGSPTATTTTTSGPQVSAPAPGALPGVIAPSSSSPSDLCLLHPEILACADITKLNDLPAVVIPNINKNLTTLTPVALGGPAICPPPLILPGMMVGPPITLDLAKPICNFATSIRAINLICGSLASFWIISLGFKQNG